MNGYHRRNNFLEKFTVVSRMMNCETFAPTTESCSCGAVSANDIICWLLEYNSSDYRERVGLYSSEMGLEQRGNLCTNDGSLDITPIVALFFLNRVS